MQDNAKKTRIYMLTGGGSGGHITPLLAVADELKQLDSGAQIVTVGERGSKFAHLTQSHEAISKTYSIFAGKFRRYHDDSTLKKLLDIKTNMLNLRDMVFFGLGTIQSIWLVRKVRPDVVFLKGGFVGVPIGLAAAFWRVPIVTHDSDALPGLANRLVSRWVSVHATGMPEEYYQYPKDKTRYVGVLVGGDYEQVTNELQAGYRKELNIPEDAKVLFVTGGSLGSKRVNSATAHLMPQLLDSYPTLHVVHQVGRGNLGDYNGFMHERLQVLEFLSGMYRYSGAADVIVTRAGANTIAEFGIQGKACIIVPSPFLAGGHQLKNGRVLEEKQAAIIVDEENMVKDPIILKEAIDSLLTDAEERYRLEQALRGLAVPGSVAKLSRILTEQAKGADVQ